MHTVTGVLDTLTKKQRKWRLTIINLYFYTRVVIRISDSVEANAQEV